MFYGLAPEEGSAHKAAIPCIPKADSDFRHDPLESMKFRLEQN
jgi:hypothetical protein